MRVPVDEKESTHVLSPPIYGRKQLCEGTQLYTQAYNLQLHKVTLYNHLVQDKDPGWDLFAAASYCRQLQR